MGIDPLPLVDKVAVVTGGSRGLGRAMVEVLAAAGTGYQVAFSWSSQEEAAREVLALIKEDDDLRSIPTVILTTSEADVDILKSYQLKANAYLSKPVQLDAFERLVVSIGDFWINQVKLPHKLGWE